MTPLHRHHRRGMTLVELLVVVAIIGLLAVAVLPNLADSAGSRRIRESARGVSSFVASAQSQAIGSRAGAGVWIEPLENRLVDDAGEEHAIALDMSFCDVPQPYRGETTDAVVELPQTTPPTPLTATSRKLQFIHLVNEPLLAPNFPTLPNNLFIKLGRGESAFRLAYDGSSWVAEMDALRQQSPLNTFWPVTQPGVGVPYEVILPPRKNPARSMTVELGIAIDLTWTIFTNPPATWPPGNDLLLSNPVQLIYSTTGKPSLLIRNGSQGIVPQEPFYVLVTSIEAIQERTAFTTARGYWVAVDPSGGIPRVAEVLPLTGYTADTGLSLSDVVPTNIDELKYTQRFIREASLQTGG